MPFAIVDFRRFDAAKYEVICCDWYYMQVMAETVPLEEVAMEEMDTRDN